ncbi:alpha/beta hydrolase [Paenibacillus sp. LHD-117]|uniref:alpha/beta hydrolase n=1 Tax=Paenibacillus sp. LHD-117 TaxID=3071412 RepID=UPI0027DFB1E3|nr:alpha/beta hydrolase [Paenibacillus sp. LHD-117]MDQ6421634.1 alpha/beta hydrolase [Paenibacillus sp. LHD-117]
MNNNDQYQQLVSRLQDKAVSVLRDDYEFVVKPIPDSDETGRLDPRVFEIQKAFAMSATEMPKIDPSNLHEFVQGMRSMMGWDNLDITLDPIDTAYKVIEGTNGLIPMRIYSPSREGLKPAIVFFHGGGFIGGTVDVVENPCKALAEKAGAVVVNVDYRLAPEHAYPAGLNDCFEAVQWVYEHAEELGVNPQQIGVAGDSAGGNMAAVCALMDRDQGTGMIRYQALIYPTVNMGNIETEDFRWSLDEYEIRDHRELIVGGIQELGEGSDMIIQLYLQNRAELTDPYFAPLLADDLTGLPETLIVTAEYDYLRIENEAFARKLARTGIATKLIQYNGMDHAFMDKIGQYPQAEDCMSEIAKDVRRIFA